MDAKKPMGMYIHIPFCSKKCDYCDFVSYAMDKKAQQEYLIGLFSEIDQLKDKYEYTTFDTIYIGGGTPSIMFEGFFSSLARKLYSTFKFADKIEFSIEVNPSSFTREKFLEYAEAGINRISVGLQSLDSKLLERHGRMQSVESVKNTFNILKQSQFKNVNADVMIGLPGQTPKMVKDTIKFLIKHKVKHVSTYGLQIEKNTALYDNIQSGAMTPVDDELIAKLYGEAYTLLKHNGYVRYELSNYSKPGFECKHNRKYWNESEFLGLGVSAYSYVDGYRYFNTKRLDTYLDLVGKGKSPIYKKEYISNEQRRTERIMLSLRTNRGLDLKKFQADFGEDLMKTHSAQILKLQNEKIITIKNDIMKINEKFYYVSNSVMLELM